MILQCGRICFEGRLVSNNEPHPTGLIIFCIDPRSGSTPSDCPIVRLVCMLNLWDLLQNVWLEIVCSSNQGSFGETCPWTQETCDSVLLHLSGMTCFLQTAHPPLRLAWRSVPCRYIYREWSQTWAWDIAQFLQPWLEHPSGQEVLRIEWFNSESWTWRVQSHSRCKREVETGYVVCASTWQHLLVKAASMVILNKQCSAFLTMFSAVQGSSQGGMALWFTALNLLGSGLRFGLRFRLRLGQSAFLARILAVFEVFKRSHVGLESQNLAGLLRFCVKS